MKELSFEEYRNSLLHLPEFRKLTIKEEIDYIDSLDYWSDADPDCWQYLCNRLEIDFHDYDDPDKLFEAIKRKAKEQNEY